MFAYVLKRLLLGVLIVITVSIVTIAMVNVTGDLAAAVAGEDATLKDVEAIRISLRLDRPVTVRYLE